MSLRQLGQQFAGVLHGVRENHDIYFGDNPGEARIGKLVVPVNQGLVSVHPQSENYQNGLDLAIPDHEGNVYDLSMRPDGRFYGNILGNEDEELPDIKSVADFERLYGNVGRPNQDMIDFNRSVAGGDIAESENGTFILGEHYPEHRRNYPERYRYHPQSGSVFPLPPGLRDG